MRQARAAPAEASLRHSSDLGTIRLNPTTIGLNGGASWHRESIQVVGGGRGLRVLILRYVEGSVG